MHAFIFQPGIWLGEGTISFSSSPERIKFFTRWEIEAPDDEGHITCKQNIEMHGVPESTQNSFIISEQTSEGFIIELSNQLIESIVGRGIIDDQTLAWEFRGQDEIEGMEVYRKKERGRYTLHAEYTATEQYRTTINGELWLT